MPHFAEEKVLPYTPKQVFDLVADVAQYPEFLPWCVGARIYGRKSDQFDADVMIGFKMFRERFTSRVSFVEQQSLNVDYIKGPMKRLYNHWKFSETEEGYCHVDFEVDFEFANKFLNDMIGGLFEKACHKMVSAFEERAQELYG
jgi:coenzyme Q-binding protein COQ10